MAPLLSVAAVAADAQGRTWAGNPTAVSSGGSHASLEGGDVAFRFRAEASGCLRTLTFPWRFREPSRKKAMYRRADGGTYEVQLRPDADTAAVPSETVLARAELAPAVSDAVGAPIETGTDVLSFTGEGCLRQGSFYHLVFVNRHPRPDVARISFTASYLDGPSEDGLSVEALPCPECADATVLLRPPGGSWGAYADARDAGREPRFYLPAWCATLDTGAEIGQPVQYGHKVVSPPPYVSGARRVRQRLLPPVGSTLPVSIHVYASRLVGASPLEVSIDGRVVASLSDVSATSMVPAPDGRDARDFDWYTVVWSGEGVEGNRATAGSDDSGSDRVPSPLWIEFRTAGDTAYEIAANLHVVGGCGTGDDDMRAETSADGGRSWSGLSALRVDDRDNARLSLYLTVGSTAP